MHNVVSYLPRLVELVPIPDLGEDLEESLLEPEGRQGAGVEGGAIHTVGQSLKTKNNCAVDQGCIMAHPAWLMSSVPWSTRLFLSCRAAWKARFEGTWMAVRRRATR